MAFHAQQLLDICESMDRPSDLIGDTEHLTRQVLNDGQALNVILDADKSDVKILSDNLKDFGFDISTNKDTGITSIYRDPKNTNEISSQKFLQIVKQSGAVEAKVGEVNLLGYATEPGASQ